MIATVRDLSRLLRRSTRWLLVSALISLVQSGLLLAIGLLMRHALDHTIPRGEIGSLVLTGAALLGISLVSGALALLTRAVSLTVTKRAIARLRSELIERTLAAPSSWHDRHTVAEVHSVLVQDTERLDIMGNAVAAQLVPALIVTAALGVALAVIDPLLTALLAAALPLMMLLTRATRQRVGRLTRSWQQAFDAFNARVMFVLRARSLVVSQSAEALELDRARAEIEALSAAGRSMAWSQGAYGQLTGMVGTALAVIVLVVGGAAVAHHDLTLGTLVAFYALAALLRGQLSPLLSAVPQLISGRESLRRLDALLAGIEVPPYGGTRRPQAPHAIRLRDVTFGYRHGEPVLGGVDLELHRGERVALAGRNGAGKTTIAALVLGLYRPWRGELSADGVAYEELDVRALRRHMAVVAQHPILFPGTIAENIAYGESAVDIDRVRGAATLATADEFIMALPDGYETRVGDDGELLSGGQGQRIAIARALLREPAVLILDEPTSSLDADSVRALLATLSALPWKPAVLVISHQRGVLDDADRIYELAGGRLSAPARL